MMQKIHFFVPKICTYQKKAVPLQRKTKNKTTTKNKNNMKQATINAQITKNLGNYESVRLGGEWSIEDEDPSQAYRSALAQLNQVFDELYHPKKKDAQNEKKQVVEFGTPLLQSICNRIAEKADHTLEKIEQYYDLTPEAKKTIMIALKMR